MSLPPLIFARTLRGRAGFTLIELLVVMAIIAILTAILVPVFGLVRSRMDSTQCLTQLSQVGTAMNAYINDHDGMMPGPLSFSQSASYTPNQPGSLAALLENYLGTASTLSPDGTSRYSPLLECPAAARKQKDRTKPTYIVTFLPSPENGQSIWGDVEQNQKPLRKSALVNWTDASSGGAPLTLAETWAIQDGDQNYVSVTTMPTGPSADLLPTAAHEDHWNDLFFDFHVGSRSSLISVQSPTGSTPVPSSH